MAVTRLSDIIEPTVYADYDAKNTFQKSALVQSGIVVSNGELDAVAAGAGRIAEMPFWKDLADSEANVSSDDPEQKSTPEKLASGLQTARRVFLNKSWSSADLASDIAGSNAQGRIKERVEAYWTRQNQKRLIATARGIIAGNLANNSGDMIHDVSVDTAGAPTAASYFSRSAFTSAAFTLGDAFENTGAIAVHSVVYKRMIDNDDIEFVKDSAGAMVVPTYLGRIVIVDDGMPAIAGTNQIKYTSILFGAGAFGYGEGSPDVPLAVTRDEAAGNGGGVETLTSRKTNILHPYGFAFTSTTVAGASPTLAELALPANWNRVFAERKQVPLAFLITN